MYSTHVLKGETYPEKDRIQCRPEEKKKEVITWLTIDGMKKWIKFNKLIMNCMDQKEKWKDKRRSD